MSWTYTLDDGTVGELDTDDQAAAWAEAEAIADGRLVMLLERTPVTAPTIVRAASGVDVVLDVTEDGAVTATPAAP